VRIPVHYYTDISSLTTGELADYFLGKECYVSNIGGKTYLVEILI
jgi:hypothetical protein